MRSQLQYWTNDVKINLKKIVTGQKFKIKEQFKLKYGQCWCFSLSNNARIKILIFLKVWYCYKLYQYNTVVYAAHVYIKAVKQPASLDTKPLSLFSTVVQQIEWSVYEPVEPITTNQVHIDPQAHRHMSISIRFRWPYWKSKKKHKLTEAVVIVCS